MQRTLHYVLPLFKTVYKSLAFSWSYFLCSYRDLKTLGTSLEIWRWYAEISFLPFANIKLNWPHINLDYDSDHFVVSAGGR
jgi:hypothetical protein